MPQRQPLNRPLAEFRTPSTQGNGLARNQLSVLGHFGAGVDLELQASCQSPVAGMESALDAGGCNSVRVGGLPDRRK